MGTLLRGLLRRSGLGLTTTARRGFRYLAQYYPPFYYQGYIEKLVGFHAILRSADELSLVGDVVECGVGRGLTFYMLGHFLSRRRSDRHLYGFDSFAGFPAPSAADISSRNPQQGDLWSDTSIRHVADHFRRGELADYFAAHVHFVPGFLADTLPKAYQPRTIALLNLDVDLYESYRDCLQHLGPRVTGVIVYDEYQSSKWPGATRAVNEQLPLIGHRLFYSAVMERFLSVPAHAMTGPFVQQLTDRLNLRSVQ